MSDMRRVYSGKLGDRLVNAIIGVLAVVVSSILLMLFAVFVHLIVEFW